MQPFNCEFQLDISILASWSEKKSFDKKPIPPIVFEIETVFFSMNQQSSYKDRPEAEFLILTLNYP